MTFILNILILLLPFGFCSAKNLKGKVVFISGGATGIGYETAKAFSEKGAIVYATTRNLSKIQKNARDENIHFFAMDLRDSNSIKKAFCDMLLKEKRIDILVNNAGFGILGAEESVSKSQLLEIFQVNFFGAVELMNLALPYMREQKQGHIVNISSTSGVRGLPGIGTYAASKFALEGYSEALSLSVSPFGIKVSIIQPGTVKNNWAANCLQSQSLDDVLEYNHLKKNLSRLLIELSQRAGQEQIEIGKLIALVAEDDHPKLRYQTSPIVQEKLLPFHNDLSGEKFIKTFTPFLKELIK